VRLINIPLSAMDHAVGQRGAFTGLPGLAMDKHKGRFYMLPETLASLVTARDDLAAVHGWAAVLHMSPDEPGIEVVGGYRTAVDLLGSAFINPAALPVCARLPCRAGVSGDARQPPRYPGSYNSRLLTTPF
jgi:hypothetical protein